MNGPAKVSVYFGGAAHEIWTNSGLSVSYTGRHEVCAVRDGAVYRAEAPVPARSGDVKADYNELAKSEELARRDRLGSAVRTGLDFEPRPSYLIPTAETTRECPDPFPAPTATESQGRPHCAAEACAPPLAGIRKVRKAGPR